MAWWRSIVLAAGLLVTLAAPAQASSGAQIDQSQTAWAFSIGHVSGSLAETFTAGKSGTLDHVSLVNSSQFRSSMTVEILNTNSNGAPAGSPIAQSAPQALTCCAAWHDFTFSPAVQLTAGTRYAIVVPVNSTYVSWYYTSGNPYPDGQVWLTLCSSCPFVSGRVSGTDYSQLDFAFKTWVATQAAVPPAVSADSSTVQVYEGTVPAETGTFSDANGSVVGLTADAGTITAPAAASGTWSWTEPAADESAGQTVTVTATDRLGLSSTTTFSVNVSGVAPTATITSDPPTSAEGSAVPLTGKGSSPDAADNAAGFTYSWTVVKDGTPFASGSGASWSYTTADEGTYVITFQVTDDGGLSGSTNLTITGTDVTPTAKIAGVAAPTLVTTANETLSFSGSFADSASMDSHTATWDFGDGSSASTSIPAGGSTSLSASHAYGAAGTYSVTLNVKDDDGTLGHATTQVTVQTPQQALSTLTAYVQNLTGLNKGERNSLTAKLNAASASAGRGDMTAAHNQLNAFVNEVNAYANAGKLTAQQAATLRGTAHMIQAALGTYNRFLEWALEL